MDEIGRPIRSVLANGMTVITERTERKGIIGGEILFKCGAAHAHAIDKNWTGLPHFDEHVVVNGASKHHQAGQAKKLLADKYHLYVNATTGLASTRYFTTGGSGQVVPKEKIWDALTITADGVLYPKYDKKTVAQQYKRILEEYDRDATKLAQDNDKYLVLLHGIEAVGLQVLGDSKLQIEGYKKPDFKAYAKYRQPLHLVLSLVGDIDHKTAIQRAAGIFAFDAQQEPPTLPSLEQGRIQPGEFRRQLDGANEGILHANLITSAPHGRDRDYYAAYIAYIGMQTILSDKIMEKFGLYEAGFYYENRFSALLQPDFRLKIVTGQKSQATEALSFGLGLIRAPRQHRTIVERHRSLIEKAISQVRTEQLSVQQRASQLNDIELGQASVQSSVDIIRKLRQVTPDQVQDCLKTMFTGNIFMNIRGHADALNAVAAVDRITG